MITLIMTGYIKGLAIFNALLVYVALNDIVLIMDSHVYTTLNIELMFKIVKLYHGMP